MFFVKLDYTGNKLINYNRNIVNLTIYGLYDVKKS